MKRMMVYLLTLSLALTALHASAQEEAIEHVGEVARAIFTTEIDDREPVDQLSSIPAGVDRIYLFTDLRDFTGQRVVHRWVYNNVVASEVGFNVGGPRWRTWSLKAIPATQRGEWRVDVIDGEGFIVESHTISGQ